MGTRQAPGPLPPVGANGGFHGPPQQPHFQQQQQPVQRAVQQSMPAFNSTTVRDITPAVALTDDFCLRKLTAYEMHTMRPADPLDNRDFRDTKKDQGTRKSAKKDRKGSKSSTPLPQRWLRVSRTLENYDQEVLLKKIKALNLKNSSITDKKAELSSHMSTHVNLLLDEKNSAEYDSPFTWTLYQLNRITSLNKETKKRHTDILVLYLKRAPRQEVNPTTLYRDIEKAKLMRNQPPPQPQPYYEPSPPQKLPANGPAPGPAPGPGPGQGKNPAGKIPPPPIRVVNDPTKKGPPAKNGAKDEVVIVESPGRGGKGGKAVYNKCRDNFSKSRSRSRSRSSQSSRSDTTSGSESDDGSGYSSSQTDQTSLISSNAPNRRRRGSVVYSHGKGKPVKQHEKEHSINNRARRYSETVIVPDAPRTRATSHERLSRNPVDLEQLRTQAFAEGYATAAVNSAIDRASVPQQRTIAFPDDHSQRSSIRSLDGDTRTLDDIRADARLDCLRIQDDLPPRENIQFRDSFWVRDDGMVRENIRVRDDLQFKDNLQFRDDFQFRDNLRFRDDPQLRDNVRYRDDIQLTDNVRYRDGLKRREQAPIRVDIRDLRFQSDLRRAEDTIRRDSLPKVRIRDPEYLRRESLSPLSFEPLPSPRARDFGYRRAGSSPVEYELPVQYPRNPFIPNERREPPPYRH